jgi:hypothetical protein
MEEGSLLGSALRGQPQRQTTELTHLSHSERKINSKRHKKFFHDEVSQSSELLLQNLSNTLVVDLFLIPSAPSCTRHESNSSNTPEFYLTLAQIAIDLNQFIQKRHYPWYFGGDGPVFGVHVSSDVESAENDGAVKPYKGNESKGSKIIASCHRQSLIPHLRAMCRYGCSVADEWMMIGCIMEFTSEWQQSTKSPQYQMLVECWDVDDGQIVCIEAATQLPPWVDEIGPIQCRHRCWVVDGQVCLVNPRFDSTTSNNFTTMHPPSLTRSQALQILSEHLPMSRSVATTGTIATTASTGHENFITISDSMTGCIRAAIQRHTGVLFSSTKKFPLPEWYHRAILAVPRSIAYLIQQRPDIIASAIAAYNDTELDQDHHSTWHHQQSQQKSSAMGTWEDWVWYKTTDCQLSRLQYAILHTVDRSRTSTNSVIYGSGASAIPPQYRSIELRRLEHQSQIEMYPYLRHAVVMGVRLVIGIDLLLQRCTKQVLSEGDINYDATTKPKLPRIERHVLEHWKKIIGMATIKPTTEEDAPQCETLPATTWLEQAWELGPNHSTYDIQPILGCPVFEEEVLVHATPLSFPEDDSVATAIRRYLTRFSNGVHKSVQDLSTEIPSATHIDNDDWMTFPSGDMQLDQMANHGLNTNFAQNKTVADLNEVVGGFHSFVANKSSADGVEPTCQSQTKSEMEICDDSKLKCDEVNRPARIDPTVFLNMLHAVLKADDVDDLVHILDSNSTSSRDVNDPYFSRSDYDLMDASSNSSADDSSQDDDVDEGFHEMMAAMDHELTCRRTSSRNFDGDQRSHLAESEDELKIRKEEGELKTEDLHLLSNLLRSLEAGQGGPGPAFNMMREMGIDPPHIDDSHDIDYE